MSNPAELCYRCGDKCNPLRTWPCAECKRPVCTNCVPNIIWVKRLGWLCPDCAPKEEKTP